MFKKDREMEAAINKWGSIIHNDLTAIHMTNQSKTKTKKDKETYDQLRGLRDSILLDACSGIGYIHEGKFYSDLTELEKDIESIDEEIPVTRVMSVDYILRFIDQILSK